MAKLPSDPNVVLPIVKGLMTELDMGYLRSLSPNSVGFFTSEAKDGTKSLVQVARTKEPTFADVLRFVPDGEPEVKPKYWAYALVSDKIPQVNAHMLSFNIQTVHEGLRHPAMSGGAFIKFFYDFLVKKYPIIMLVGHWLDEPNQTNMLAYKTGLKAGLSRVQAAQITWSAQEFAKLGYTHIGGITEIDGTPNQLLVEFLRPNPRFIPPPATISVANWSKKLTGGK